MCSSGAAVQKSSFRSTTAVSKLSFIVFSLSEWLSVSDSFSKTTYWLQVVIFTHLCSLLDFFYSQLVMTMCCYNKLLKLKRWVFKMFYVIERVQHEKK